MLQNGTTFRRPDQLCPGVSRGLHVKISKGKKLNCGRLASTVLLGSLTRKKFRLSLPMPVRCTGSAATASPSTPLITEDNSARPEPPPPVQQFSAFATLELFADDDSVAPLKLALEKAVGRLTEVTRLREELETYAQEVGQIAVEAAEERENAKSQVTALMDAIELGTRQQQDWLDKLTAWEAKLGPARQSLEQIANLIQISNELPSLSPTGTVDLEDTPFDAKVDVATKSLEVLEADIANAKQLTSDLQRHLNEQREELELALGRSVEAEAALVMAEEAAAQAMTHVETAVKEEMEAQAVIKQTELALRNTLSDLKARDTSKSKSRKNAEARAEVAAVTAAAVATATAAAGSSVVAADVAQVKPVSSPPAVMAGDAAAAAPDSEMIKFRERWAAVGMAAAALGCLYLVSQTAAGQACLEAIGRLGQAISDKLGPFEVHDSEKGLLESIWLLLTSIISVPLVVKLLPGGNPVLGYLLGGALIGPHALGIVSDVAHIAHIAELGVVFLLFNIGLELSIDRLQSMAKYVFGLGSMQVVSSLLGAAAAAIVVGGLSGPSAVIVGGALAMSSTAVAIQVLEDRGEMGSRHGRAAFSVLLLQDLAVVVLLMLIPLLAPGESGGGGIARLAQALGLAAVKAVLCIAGLVAGGRMVVRPLYRKISSFANAEIFAATTLLLVLGTSLLTQLAGLSLALGAFLAGLLLSETEYALQVESDIAPYKGLLMGLFFMTVGMDMSVQLFCSKWQVILGGVLVLLVGKTAVVAAIGPLFGLSRVAAIRAGLMLAPGGEFAFVAFGESVARGVLLPDLSAELYLVVALSMAMTPYLAMLGSKLSAVMKSSTGDKPALQAPAQGEVEELKNHVIIAGYGRAGQLIAQMLSEQLIPFVAVDVRSDRVQTGRDNDLPVYFGDAGSAAVLHCLGAEHAACAIITLDTPGANYRAVWAMKKHFPHVKMYARAHDVNHGINLEKAGALAVVPETLEPSLQLAAAVFTELKFPDEEVSSMIDSYRKKHLAELQALSLVPSPLKLSASFSPSAAAKDGPGAAAKTAAKEPALAGAAATP